MADDRKLTPTSERRDQVGVRRILWKTPQAGLVEVGVLPAFHDDSCDHDTVGDCGDRQDLPARDRESNQ